MAEAPYSDITELRGAATADDPDDRAEAYRIITENDFQVKEVLSQDPPVDALEDAGLIEPSGPDYPDGAEWRQDVLEKLDEIAENTAGSGGA